MCWLRILSLVGVAALLSASAGCGGGDGGPTTGEVTGRVCDAETGSGISGAEVTVETQAPVSTQADGSYTVTGVRTGDRDLSVTASTYEPYSTTVSVRAGTNNMDDIYLVPSGGGPPPPP